MTTLSPNRDIPHINHTISAPHTLDQNVGSIVATEKRRRERATNAALCPYRARGGSLGALSPSFRTRQIPQSGKECFELVFANLFNNATAEPIPLPKGTPISSGALFAGFFGSRRGKELHSPAKESLRERRLMGGVASLLGCATPERGGAPGSTKTPICSL